MSNIKFVAGGNIKFVLGKAGTGKTTTILQSLKNYDSVLCIAYTHSAVENLKSKSKGTFKYMTIHKYLKLPINKIIYRKLKEYERYNYIVIDEVSLIPLNIIDILFNLTNYFKETKFIFIGDLLQLPCINKDIGQGPLGQRHKKMLNIKQKYIKHYPGFKDVICSLDNCLKLVLYLNDTIYFNEYFMNSDKMILTYNYRNNEFVQSVINELIYVFYFDELKENIKKHMININELYIYKDYVKLASRYKYLKTLYSISNIKKDNEKCVNCKIGEIFIKNGDILVANENIEDMDLVNGEEYIIKDVDDELLMFNIKKFLPYNYLTIHKSQGKTLDKIVVCIDDLFEISMFYTALTRAKTDIKLVSLGGFDKYVEKIKDNNVLFNILNNVLYNS